MVRYYKSELSHCYQTECEKRSYVKKNLRQNDGVLIKKRLIITEPEIPIKSRLSGPILPWVRSNRTDTTWSYLGYILATFFVGQTIPWVMFGLLRRG